jgi:CheY-like chemotaxis protein
MNESVSEKNRRILVVDDNTTIHQDFRKILEATPVADDTLDDIEAALFDSKSRLNDWDGFEIDSAYQGAEGLTKVLDAFKAGRPYSLAFVDMRMPPGWDGVETIAHLWKADPRLQIVICTAYSDYSWEQIIQQLGNRDNLAVLKKPFDNVEVLQLAEALTQKWFLTQELQRRGNRGSTDPFFALAAGMKCSAPSNNRMPL